METRLGQVAPLVMVTEAIPSRLPLLSWRWKRVPRDPVRTPDVSSCPEWTSASKASPRRTSCSCGLSCSCIQPRRAPDTHLTTPWIVFFWGGELVELRLEWLGRVDEWARRPPAIMAPRVPRSAMTSSCVFRPGGPCPVRVCPEGPPERPQPPLPVEPLRRGFRGGGGSYVSHVSCESCVSLSCPYLVCFLSSSSVIIS